MRILLCAWLALGAVLVRAHEGDHTWHGLHPTAGTPPEFVYPFDGHAPKLAAVLHNHHATPSPAVVASVRVNGQPLAAGIELSAAGPLVIPPFDYAFPSIPGSGVFDGRFGPPPAVGETKSYRIEFTFALAPGATSPHANQHATTTLVQDVKFTNLGDTPALAGPITYTGTFRAAGATAPANPRVEVATPFSPWFSVPVTTTGAGVFSFSQALPLRHDWHVRLSADGFETRVIWLGFSNDPVLALDVTLAPAAAPEIDYERRSAITTPTGFWRAAVAEGEGTFVVFPGQQTWKTAATEAEARALRAAGRVAKHRFDGTRVWAHAPGWETWGGDMTHDGRFVAYALTPIARSFHAPAENKLVLLDGATGAVLWSKAAAPGNNDIGRKLETVEVRFSPDARWLAVGSLASGQVTLIERATGNFAWSSPSSGIGFGEIQKLVFSPDSEFLYCGGGDGAVRKLRVADGTVVWRAFVGGAPELNGLSLTSDGAWLVAGTKSLEVAVVRTADAFMQWQGGTQSPDAILAPDARHFATSGGQVYRTTESTLVGMTKSRGVARFTPDGKHLVQLGREFRLFDLGGKLLKTFDPSALGANAAEEPAWAHLTRDGRHAIVIARDLPNPPQAGIVIYERRVAPASVMPPTIVSAPLAQRVVAGGSATLSVAATGSAPLAYRWQRDGADVPGAESAVLTIPRASAADAGAYTAVVSNAARAVTSIPAALEVVDAEPANPPRIANVSVRAVVNGPPLIVGFAVGGAGTTGTKNLLLRGAGPALSAFTVSDPLRDPHLTLFSGATSVLANDNWSGSAEVAALATQVGAFPFSTATSADAAMAVTSVGGSFTMHLASNDGTTGAVLAEIYDGAAVFSASTPRLVNISARADAGGGNVLIAGFVVTGSAAKTVLVRGIGPALAQFGVSGALADPQLAIMRGEASVATNDNWYEAANAIAIGAAAARVGAFRLSGTSRDAALLLSLPPGSYTAQVSAAGNAAGSALVEVYEVP